jgi:hypothetical protein
MLLKANGELGRVDTDSNIDVPRELTAANRRCEKRTLSRSARKP